MTNPTAVAPLPPTLTPPFSGRGVDWNFNPGVGGARGGLMKTLAKERKHSDQLSVLSPSVLISRSYRQHICQEMIRMTQIIEGQRKKKMFSLGEKRNLRVLLMHGDLYIPGFNSINASQVEGGYALMLSARKSLS